MENVKEVEFEIEGIKHKVIVKRLNWGEKNELERDAIVVKLQGRITTPTVDTAKLKESAITRSVSCETYNFKDSQKVKNLPSEVGELLWNTFLELHEQNFYVETPSKTLSEAESQTTAQ